jgi:hypothetical protein
MDGKTKMSFQFTDDLSLEVQIEDCAVKAFRDEFGKDPTVCEVPAHLASDLPERIGTMEVRTFIPEEMSPPNEYWVGIEEDN